MGLPKPYREQIFSKNNTARFQNSCSYNGLIRVSHYACPFSPLCGAVFSPPSKYPMPRQGPGSTTDRSGPGGTPEAHHRLGGIKRIVHPSWFEPTQLLPSLMFRFVLKCLSLHLICHTSDFCFRGLRGGASRSIIFIKCQRSRVAKKYSLSPSNDCLRRCHTRVSLMTGF